MSKRTGLGKGLGALFGEEYTDNKTPVVKEEGTPINSDAELNGESAQQAKQEVKVIEVEKEKVINISLIEPNSSQPRKMFDEEQLLELAASIKSYGVLQPVLVKKKEDHYELIAGERRWRAAKLAGLKEIPVIIREYTKQQTMEIALIENVQREDLNPIEEARAYQMLILNQITGGHARTLLALEDGDQQHQVAMKVMNNRLSVRETEKLVKLLTKPPVQKEEKPEEKDLSIFYQDLEDKLKNVVGTKVVINKKDKNKGRIEIEYYSSAELERIVDLIQSIGQ